MKVEVNVTQEIINKIAPIVHKSSYDVCKMCPIADALFEHVKDTPGFKFVSVNHNTARIATVENDYAFMADMTEELKAFINKFDRLPSTQLKDIKPVSDTLEFLPFEEYSRSQYYKLLKDLGDNL